MKGKKYCKGCRNNLLYKNFYNCASNKDGKYYICKKCTEKKGEGVSIEFGRELVYIQPIFDKQNDFKETETRIVIGRVEPHKDPSKCYVILPSRV